MKKNFIDSPSTAANSIKCRSIAENAIVRMKWIENISGACNEKPVNATCLKHLLNAWKGINFAKKQQNRSKRKWQWNKQETWNTSKNKNKSDGVPFNAVQCVQLWCLKTKKSFVLTQSTVQSSDDILDSGIAIEFISLSFNLYK